eukprot:jgi/Psemu1/26432/gm1.26432_g
MSQLGCYSCDKTFKAEELFQIHPCQHTICPRHVVNGLLLKKRVNEVEKEKDPFRYFSYNISNEEQTGKMLIALIDWSLESADSDRPKRMVAMFHQGGGAIEKSNEQEMIDILIKLHVSVFQDERPIARYFYALSLLGQHDIKEDKENARIDSKIKSRVLANGVIVYTMLLRLVNCYKTFLFQVMLGRIVSTMTGSTALQNFIFLSVRLSTHRTTEHNQNSIDAIKNIQTGVYVKAYNHTQNCNLWGEGPPNIIDNKNLISLSKQTPILTAILYSWSESGKRIKEYCKGNNTKLHCLRSNAGQLEKDVIIEIIKSTSSVNLGELKVLGRSFVNNEHIDFLDIGPVSAYDKKDALLEALVTTRRIYFKEYPDPLSMVTSCDARANEIKEGVKFYKFHSVAVAVTQNFSV